mmetsp:Transcript_6085/g.15943  ORF Transcript_6085/g.15943 Transcript_6085/m.15943 type:complete len:521 (-) Transcript_6085:33-1595(-)
MGSPTSFLRVRPARVAASLAGRPCRAIELRVRPVPCFPASGPSIRVPRGDRLPRRAQPGASCSGRSPSPTPRSGSTFDGIGDDDFKQAAISPGASTGRGEPLRWDKVPRLPADIQLPPSDSIASGSAVGFRPSPDSGSRDRSGRSASLRNGTASLADGGKARSDTRCTTDARQTRSTRRRRGSRGRDSLTTDVQRDDTSDGEADDGQRAVPSRLGRRVASTDASSETLPQASYPSSTGRDERTAGRKETRRLPPAHPRPTQAQRPRDGVDHPGTLRKSIGDGINLWALPVDQPRQPAGSWAADRPEVFVILYGADGSATPAASPPLPGATEEGIYSLRAINRADGLPTDTIIAFECQADAQRYAGQLEGTFGAASLSKPTVCSIPPPELLSFCVEAGYSVRLEPTGSTLVPPDFNVGATDWERSQRLRAGRFSVLEEEPFPQARLYRRPGEPAPGDPLSGPPADSSGSEDEVEDALLGMERHLDYLSDLDRNKLQLERLLLLPDEGDNSPGEGGEPSPSP